MNKKIGEKEVRAKVLHRLRGLKKQALRQAAKVGSEMVAGAMSSIHKGIDIGQRSSLTASERKRLASTRLDKMEVRILKMLSGWSIAEIEALLVHRVVPEAKRRATVPK